MGRASRSDAGVKIERGSGIRFADMFHGHDERIPVTSLAWGAEILDAVVREISAPPRQPRPPSLSRSDPTPAIRTGL